MPWSSVCVTRLSEYDWKLFQIHQTREPSSKLQRYLRVSRRKISFKSGSVLNTRPSPPPSLDLLSLFSSEYLLKQSVSVWTFGHGRAVISSFRTKALHLSNLPDQKSSFVTENTAPQLKCLLSNEGDIKTVMLLIKAFVGRFAWPLHQPIKMFESLETV